MNQSNVQKTPAQAQAPISAAEATPTALPAQVLSKIEELQAQVAALTKLGEESVSANGKPLSAAEVQAIIDQQALPSELGSMSRPLIGLIHPVARVPIFNGSRPTGKGK